MPPLGADPRWARERSTQLSAARDRRDARTAHSRSRYERLVVALGAVARALPIPGLAEHGYGFKDLADAIALRNHVLREVEVADAGTDEAHARRHLTFVFVGAGYAGVEALAELSDLVRDALRYYPRLQKVAAALGARRRAHRRSCPRSRRSSASTRQGAGRRGVDIRVGHDT